nr:DNA (cytosine-5)-methyltransferase DRM2-like isoform X1 [Ipomoea batatas]
MQATKLVYDSTAFRFVHTKDPSLEDIDDIDWTSEDEREIEDILVVQAAAAAKIEIVELLQEQDHCSDDQLASATVAVAEAESATVRRRVRWRRWGWLMRGMVEAVAASSLVRQVLLAAEYTVEGGVVREVVSAAALEAEGGSVDGREKR